MSQSKHSFYIHWGSLALGLLLGVFGVGATLFARRERRDKFYSALLGCALSMALSLALMKYIFLPR